ncbi:MAG TPA: galactokinase [Lacipirellulaceae bacterium]|nr:galactokinase [Lacipirellulaceae bacterium]
MLDIGLTQLAASAVDYFRQRFARAPQWLVAAPGRVNLIGEHIDYNDGFVLPMAIDRYCVIAAGDWPLFLQEGATAQSGVEQKRGAVTLARVFSVATNEEATISLANPARNAGPGHWSNYIAGVIAGFAAHNLHPSGFQAVIESSVPVGAGLSSSAAIEVATATLLEAMTGHVLEPVEKALLCQQAEHEYAGVPCGIMDQFASVMCRQDYLMLLDCRSQQIEHIPFVNPNITVLIINTNVKHELSGSEYAERRGQCESAAHKLGIKSLRDATFGQLELRRNELSDAEYRRARHAIGEIARTLDAADAIKAGHWLRVGTLMCDSHESLRDDYEVSCRELDLLVDLARNIGPAGGVIGSRMTGGGFGGCTVSLVETAKVDEIVQELAQSYRIETGIEPSVIASRPARGVHIVQAT